MKNSKLTKFAALFLLTVCTSSGAGTFTTAAEDAAEGAGYKRDLVQAISVATRIVVTEHSNEFDLFDTGSGESLIKEPVEYGKRTLSDAQKLQFASTIDSLDATTQDAFPACVFEPHHTVEFYVGSKLTSRMQICFLCGQVEWTGTSKTPPLALYGGLGKVIESIGLSPERDWRALAKASKQK